MLHLQFHAITPVVKRLMIACGVIFLVQLLLPSGLDPLVADYFGLSVTGIMRGWVWQFLTYAFLHGSLLHLLLNMLGLFFLGPELERHLGPRIFFIMFIFCAVLGGAGWLLITWPYEGICVGASGGIFGLIGAYAGLFPRRNLTLLVFFVLPVTMPAWLLAVLFGIFQLAYLLEPGASNIAYAAHLAGGVAGYLFVRVMVRPQRVPVFEGFTYHPPEPSRQEIDAILDKISRDGLHTLTPRERVVLKNAGRRKL